MPYYARIKATAMGKQETDRKRETQEEREIERGREREKQRENVTKRPWRKTAESNKSIASRCI